MAATGDERFIKEIVLTTVEKCGSCGRQYVFDNVSVLGHEEQLWFLMVVCDGCHKRGLVAALISDHKRPQIIGDVLEARPEAVVAGVTSADVSAMRDFLQEFDGDFKSLFADGRPKPM